MSMQDDRDEKDVSPIDLSRDENDSDPDGKSRTKHLRIHEKLSSPSRIRYLFIYWSISNYSIVFCLFRPLSETLREADERQGNRKKMIFFFFIYIFT